MALRAAGICRGGVSWANYFTWQKTLGNFEAWIDEQHDKGRRLIDVETYVVNGQRRWAGVVRSGNWTQKFVHSLDPTTFPQQLFNDPANQGLVPFNLEAYIDGGKVYFAAILRSGLLQPNITIVPDVGLSALKTANEQHIDEGLRLVDIETYVSGGKRRWAAIWFPGDWKSYLLTDLSFQSFKEQTQKKFDDEGMRLIDVETYIQGGQRLWAGFGRKGTWANTFLAEYSLQTFKDKVQQLFDEKGRRIIKLEMYEV
jgi:hypothetical protein